MVARLRRENGVSLTELMIATILLSVVFLACISLYVSAMNFFKAQKDRWARIDSFLAMEHMTRRIVLGNDILLNPGQKWVKVRWDYTGDYFTPNRTPNNYADDQWLKYGIVGNTLRWRVDATPDANVSGSDPEVQAGLFVDTAGSFFLLNNPGGPSGPPTLDVRLRTRIQQTPDVFMTQHTGLDVRGRAVD